MIKSNDCFIVGDKTEYRPFHNYTMKQAIEEHLIMDIDGQACAMVVTDGIERVIQY